MNVKKFLPILLSVGASAFVLSGCSDFDNGWTEKELKYRENFANAFGKIDPEQDWNLATRAAVTVTTGSPTDVKIYAKTDGTYRIVADYADVTGTQKLGFDMREDVTDLIVTNGSQSFYVKPGEDVAFGATTRATTTATADGLNTAGVTLSDYVEFDADRYVGDVIDKTNGILPEGSSNLKKVTQNFSYISNGPFTIHPLYWNSSSEHILGVYWKVGNTYKYQDVYKDKESDDEKAELAYRDEIIYSGECIHDFPVTAGMTCDAGHNISYVDSHGNKYYDVPESEGIEEVCHYLYEKDKWGNVGGICDHGYKITVAGQDIDGFPQKHLRTKNQCYDKLDKSVHVGDECPQGDKIIYIDPSNYKRYTIMSEPSYHAIYTDEARNEGKIYSKGITIDLPVGTLFGFYLKVYDGETYYHTLYSQGELNKSQKGKFFDPSLVTAGGCCVITNGLNNEGTEAWAATFQHEINGQAVQYLCFEDWSVDESDLNDLVFATPVTDGYTPPSIVDEDAAAWIICAEDLGNNFDIDYNDVVVEVKHVSGSTTATVSPIAAGGTLASYIYFNDATGGTQCLGEVHELLGQANNESGKYTPINVDGNVNTSIIKDYKFNVANDWSIASSTVGDANFNSNAAMGGFTVKVVPQGTQASESAATIEGQKIQNSTVTGTENVPFVFCVPRDWNRIEGTTKYSSWFRWSKELTPMTSIAGYNKFSYNTTGHAFADWVANHDEAKDWYKYPNLDNTMGVMGITETQVSEDSGSEDNRGTLLTEISGVLTNQEVWSCSGYFIPASALTGATAITFTIEGNDFTTFMANSTQSASCADSNKSSTISVPEEKLEDYVANGFYFAFNSGYEHATVYIKIIK